MSGDRRLSAANAGSRTDCGTVIEEGEEVFVRCS